MMLSKSVAAFALFSSIAGALKVSPNGHCGASFGLTCAGSRYGDCCSKNGWCGSTPAYCKEGCQSKYGKCSTPVKPVSKNGRCGADNGGQTCQNSVFGNCCSNRGYCGRTGSYCGGYVCQKEYGSCEGGAAPSSVRTTLSSIASTRPASSGYSVQPAPTCSAQTVTLSASVVTKSITQTTTVTLPGVTLPGITSILTLTGDGSVITLPGGTSVITVSGDATTITIPGEGATITVTGPASTVTLPEEVVTVTVPTTVTLPEVETTVTVPTTVTLPEEVVTVTVPTTVTLPEEVTTVTVPTTVTLPEEVVTVTVPTTVTLPEEAVTVTVPTTVTLPEVETTVTVPTTVTLPEEVVTVTVPTTVTLPEVQTTVTVPTTVTLPGEEELITVTVPTTVTLPGEEIPVTLDASTVTIPAQTPSPITVTLPAPEASTVTLPANTVTLPAPDAVTVTLPAPDASTVTLPAVTANPVTVTATPNVPAVVCPTGDAVVNGGFESSLTGNWFSLTAGSANVDRVSIAPASGSSTYVLRARSNSDGQNLPVRLLQVVTLCPGLTYELTASARRVTTSGSIGLSGYVQLAGSPRDPMVLVGGTVTSAQLTPLQSINSGRIQVPAGGGPVGALLYFEFTYSGGSGSAKEAQLDEVHLTPLS